MIALCFLGVLGRLLSMHSIVAIMAGAETPSTIVPSVGLVSRTSMNGSQNATWVLFIVCVSYCMNFVCMCVCVLCMCVYVNVCNLCVCACVHFVYVYFARTRLPFVFSVCVHGWWLHPRNWKMLARWKESYDKPGQHIKKSRDITLPTKIHVIKAMVFSVVM